MSEEQQSIWTDPDVRQLFDMSSGRPMLRTSMLGPIDAMMFDQFAHVDMSVGMDASAADFLNVCLSGIYHLEYTISDNVHIGLRKFMTYQVALNASIMWTTHRNADETILVTDWVMEQCQNHGWNPDGIPGSPMGQRARWNMAVAAEAGGGVRTNPATGRFEVPTGDRAREAAKARFET